MEYKTIVFVDFQFILLGSQYFGPLATSSLNLTFSMTIKSAVITLPCLLPVIMWPCGYVDSSIWVKSKHKDRHGSASLQVGK